MSRVSPPRYVEGDYYIQDDRSGLKIRASDAVKEWNGLMVYHKDAEPRHPQDFVKGESDKQSVDDPRPRTTDKFITVVTYLSDDADIGDTTLSVDSSGKFVANNSIGVTLTTGDIHLTTVSSAPTSTSIIINDAIPGSAETDGMVVNYSAFTIPSY